MSVRRGHSHYIEGSVTDMKGTFPHTLGRKPWMVITSPMATARGSITGDILYDEVHSDDKKVVLIGYNNIFVPFRAILIDK